MIRRAVSRTAMLAWLTCLVASIARGGEAAQTGDKEGKFLRLTRDEQGDPLALETAIVRYIAAQPGGVTVDLVGAVHVGEKAYYEALNEAFQKYDVVLYELVAPAGTKIPRGSKSSNHPISALQNGLKDILKLEHQLTYVDYTKENMVHADMSPDDLSKAMADRGESFWTIFFRLMGQGIAQQAKNESRGKSFDADLLFALFDPNRAIVLKRLMAEQFEELGGVMQALEGPKGSAIVTDRNKVALQELTRQIAAGKKHIAIFYGAAHLSDMQKRLNDQFGLKRSEEHWLTAWNLRDESARKPAAAKR